MLKNLYVKFFHLSLLFSTFCLLNIQTEVESMFISSSYAETDLQSTTNAESECERIGYKRKTEKYAECVIELYSRTKKSNIITEIPKNLSQEG